MDLHDFEDVAENYDFYLPTLGADNSQIAFHLDLAKSHGAGGILDIGCGTGLILIPLIEQRFRVVGIDISNAMLTVLRRKLAGLPVEIQQNAEIIHSNMVDFELNARCSLAMIPRSGFLHLLTLDDQERTLRNIYRHLTTGGVLTFNTFDPDYVTITENLKGSAPAPRMRAQYTNSRGNWERIWNMLEYDPTRQVIEGLWIFEELNTQGEVMERRERPVRMRWSFEPEIRHLLRLCGFEVLATYGSYKKEPRTYGGWIVWVAKRE
jgi:SAM-dependent methyltransferase